MSMRATKPPKARDDHGRIHRTSRRTVVDVIPPAWVVDEFEPTADHVRPLLQPEPEQFVDRCVAAPFPAGSRRRWRRAIRG